MPPVSEKVLAWLYSILQPYFDQQRAYSDTARILQTFPSLSPRTEVYTYDSGSSALLLTFSGTLPVGFRGTVYHYPIKLWIPQSYPQEPPIAYVVPERDLQIRVGQHVGVDGRIYHPYLRDWSSMWDRASIAELLEYLQQAFAKEPPVISRAYQQQYQRPLDGQVQRSVQNAGPSLPPKQPVNSDGNAGPSSAPPRPPKPGEQRSGEQRSVEQRSTSPVVRDIGRDGPPLPPLPGERPQSVVHSHTPVSGHMSRISSSPVQQYQPHDQSSRRWSQQYPVQEIGPVSPIAPSNGHAMHLQARRISAYDQQYRHDPMPHQAVQQYERQSRHPSTPQPAVQPGFQHYDQQSRHPSAPQPVVQHYQQQSGVPPQHRHDQIPQGTVSAPMRPLSGVQHRYSATPRVPQQQPAPDLLSDPFDIALPAAVSVQAPPIPPNPEREHLLQALSATLVQQAQQKVNQNYSAIAPLQAQQYALRAAHARLEAELAQLEALDSKLASNEAILRQSIQDCDHTTATAKSKQQPPIDDVLIAPTLVAQQLWTASAEEAACREAMYALQNAVDRGRISGVDFVRHMRGLGRECFLKMALARKCARGLGLEVDRR